MLLLLLFLLPVAWIYRTHLGAEVECDDGRRGAVNCVCVWAHLMGENEAFVMVGIRGSAMQYYNALKDERCSAV